MKPRNNHPLLLLSDEDQHIALGVLAARSGSLQPDLTIGTDKPYLYRWHIVRSEEACVYLHLQVDSDPDRPLHDHPWDNTTVIMSGGYDEVIGFWPVPKRSRPDAFAHVSPIRKGEVRHRAAELPHRLILPENIPYTLTLFSTGPVRRDWGFWCRDGWRSSKECVITENGKSIWNPAVAREAV